MDLGKVRKELGNRVALQGNLDPTILYSSKEKISEEVIKTLLAYGKGEGHIFNLGHGILPDTPVENAQALVKFVKEESIKFHKL